MYNEIKLIKNTTKPYPSCHKKKANNMPFSTFLHTFGTAGFLLRSCPAKNHVSCDDISQ